MLPPTIPIFPLPNTVLFPNVFLPLHIFEPRYRAMVADTLRGDQIIGMVLLRPGWEGDYEGRPPVYPIGCAGLITHTESLPDGCFNIVLRGLEKFRITSEQDEHDYRIAQVEAILEPGSEDAGDQLRHARRRLEELLLPAMERGGAERRVPASMPDEDLVNALAQYLELEAVEKQALLERACLLDRCHSLIELLEMKVLVARHTWATTQH